MGATVKQGLVHVNGKARDSDGGQCVEGREPERSESEGWNANRFLYEYHGRFTISRAGGCACFAERTTRREREGTDPVVCLPSM